MDIGPSSGHAMGMPTTPGQRNEAVPQRQPGLTPRSRRVPPMTLRLDADIVRVCANSYQLYGPGRGCIEISGRFTERLAQALRRLDGDCTLDDACCCLHPDEQKMFEELLRRLLAFGMIHKQAYRPGAARIGVVGEGVCAERIRHTLATTNRVQGFTEPLPPRSGLDERGTRQGPAPRIDRLKHWMSIDDARLDLVLIAVSRPAPDPAMSWQLSRLGIPHLIVSAHHRDATVGPLVKPGTTSCAFCAAGPAVNRDLRSVDEPASPAPVVLDWVAAITRSVSAAYLDGGTISPTVEFSGGFWPSRAPQAGCPVCAPGHGELPPTDDSRAGQHAAAS